MTNKASVSDPIRAVLRVLCGKHPPVYVKGHDFSNLTDEQMLSLQDWCAINCKPDWATGGGCMDAAELIVREAASNGNIESDNKISGFGAIKRASTDDWIDHSRELDNIVSDILNESNEFSIKDPSTRRMIELLAELRKLRGDVA